ncbi:MAG: translation elongation factor Ts, partial [Pseudomonadota bacterium]
MTVTAALVKELRERTGLGMMECKNALVESQGDIELAIENLRKSGQAKAAKKAGRIAAEGIIQIESAEGVAVMIEINSETDFVSRDANFMDFAKKVGQVALAGKVQSIADLQGLTYSDNQNVETARQALVQKIGENIQLRRLTRLEAPVVGHYLHNGRIGVLVGLAEGDVAVTRELGMHIAALNPMVVEGSEISADILAKEREIYTEQANQSGKPEAIVAKMVEGRVQKFMAEVSLVEQGFVKDPETKVKDVLKKANAKGVRFVRFEV